MDDNNNMLAQWLCPMNTCICIRTRIGKLLTYAFLAATLSLLVALLVFLLYYARSQANAQTKFYQVFPPNFSIPNSFDMLKYDENTTQELLGNLVNNSTQA